MKAKEPPRPAATARAPEAPTRPRAAKSEVESVLALQRQAGNAAVVQALEDGTRSPVLDVVGSAGSPLEAGLRTEMEARLGADLTDVRLHTDGAADRSARAVQASAYTVGSHVAFAAGAYDPRSHAGKVTLAHELAHVLQQRHGPVDGTPAGGGISLSDPGDRFERAAESKARSAMAGPAPEAEEGAEPSAVAQRTATVDEGQLAVQRAVGFEFEMGQWRIARANVGTPVDTAAAVPRDQLATVSHRLTKGDVWASGAGVEYQADDAGPESDIEMVTRAFQETQTDRAALEAALTAIAVFPGAYNAAYGSAPVQGHGRRGDADYVPRRMVTADDLDGSLGAVAVTDHAAFITFIGPAKAKAQATIGVRLARVGTMVQDVFPTQGEGAGDRARRDPARAAWTGVTGASQEAHEQAAATGGAALSHGRQIFQILERSVGRADAAIDAYIADHRRTAPAKSDQLVSLLALVLAYLDMGKSGLVRSYAKTIAPVMARTDFGTLFSMLDATNRDYYRSGNGGRWVDLVKTAPGYSWRNIGSAIYSGGVKESQEPNEWFVDLKRKAWLKSMTRGTDLLTAAHYPTAEGRANIEGLGGYGAQIDTTATGAAAAIVELRGLKDVNLNAADLREFALNLFDYVVALNTGAVHAHVANPLPTVLPPLAGVAAVGGGGGGGGGGG